LIDVAASLVQHPSARWIVIAIELDGLDIVGGADPSGDRQAFAGLGVDEHHLVGHGLGVCRAWRAHQPENERGRCKKAGAGAVQNFHDISP
jgi:hypothetical protein